MKKGGVPKRKASRLKGRSLRVVRTADLREGATVKFSFRNLGREQEGFAFLRGGIPQAYLNECRHWNVGLDFDDNRFFTPDGRFIACVNHGALYDPGTGACVSGPCAGASLQALPVRILGPFLVLDLPPGTPPKRRKKNQDPL